MLELSATDRIRPVLADPARMHQDPTSRPMARPLIRVPDLEAAIDGVVKSYDGPEEINNLESAALPNKQIGRAHV